MSLMFGDCENVEACLKQEVTESTSSYYKTHFAMTSLLFDCSLGNSRAGDVIEHVSTVIAIFKVSSFQWTYWTHLPFLPFCQYPHYSLCLLSTMLSEWYMTSSWQNVSEMSIIVGSLKVIFCYLCVCLFLFLSFSAFVFFSLFLSFFFLSMYIFHPPSKCLLSLV